MMNPTAVPKVKTVKVPMSLSIIQETPVNVDMKAFKDHPGVTFVVSSGGYTLQGSIHHPIGVTPLDDDDWVFTATCDVPDLLLRSKDPKSKSAHSAAEAWARGDASATFAGGGNAFPAIPGYTLGFAGGNFTIRPDGGEASLFSRAFEGKEKELDSVYYDEKSEYDREKRAYDRRVKGTPRTGREPFRLDAPVKRSLAEIFSGDNVPWLDAKNAINEAISASRAKPHYAEVEAANLTPGFATRSGVRSNHDQEVLLPLAGMLPDEIVDYLVNLISSTAPPE
jgi:hypothetical protein